MKNDAITVSEFNAVLNQTLSFAYPEVVVEGEVSGFKVSQGKWVFFDLKDSDSVVGCFITTYQLKTELEDGMLIRVKAAPQLTKWGKFSLTVREVELAGEGSVKRAFDLLKAKFEKEGLFAPERKRALPEFPQKVMLITSAQAAAFNDFVTIINDRWSGVDIDHIQVQVQGVLAPAQIVEAIIYANSVADEYDAMVIIRGGGSAEDLQAFNTEEVVRAVFASDIPSIVAIGHEDDVSLAELVADVRAATPTDAARRLVPNRSEIQTRVASLTNSMLSSLENTVSISRTQLEGFYHSIEIRLNNLRYNLAEAFTRSCCAIEILVHSSVSQLESSKKLLESLDPRAILSRGYSITRINGKVIKSPSQYSSGDTIVIQLQQGKISLKPQGEGDSNDKRQTIISF
ncbi:exodeoxyribonuclease VII large subunit [Patescibacteria group bacterium]|nr:exodeoxyribonuclease VII large subunit [Patescibacteria group bacterium]